MRKFFVTSDLIGADTVLITGQDDIRHITNVLRMRPGGRLRISDGEAFEYEAVISEMTTEGIRCRIHDKQRFTREPNLQVTLFQGIPKQGKMEVVIQKTVEMGVKAIIPVFTARTVVENKGNFEKKTERWQKVSAEAAKQCRRGVIPEVRRAVTFSQMLTALQSGAFDMILFPYENEEKITMKQVLRNEGAKIRSAAIIIGPEGGFSDAEANTLKETGALPVSLGRTVLRTETAGLAALAMVMYELEM